MNRMSAQQQLGPRVLATFDYVQEIYRETKELITLLDEMVGEPWELPNSAAISAGFSRDLRRPYDWLVTQVHRIYHHEDRPHRRTGITVVYVDDQIDQPILIGGYIDYELPEATGDDVPDRWILREAWFQVSPDKRELDGIVHSVRFDPTPESGCPADGEVFAVPLVSIQSRDDVRTEVYDRLMDLQGA